MHIQLFTGATPNGFSTISPTAAELVELGPSPTYPRADRIKALAAAMIAECEVIRDSGLAGAKEAAIAITHVQSAAQAAVNAAGLMFDHLTVAE